MKKIKILCQNRVIEKIKEMTIWKICAFSKYLKSKDEIIISKLNYLIKYHKWY